MDDMTTPEPTTQPTPGPTPAPTAGPTPGPILRVPPDPTFSRAIWPPVEGIPPAPTRPASTADRPRGRRTAALVLAGSLAAATIASAGTAAFVLSTRAPAAPAGQTASSPAPNGSATLTGLDGSTAIVDVAKAASPAVVTITTSETGPASGLLGIPSTGVGSGFIYDANGWILTNFHVIEGGGTVTVTLNDGRELAGRVVSSDEAHDLAVVKIDGTGLPTIPIGSSADLKVGQLVIAIGSPLGTFTDSVTSGILSATGRSVTVLDQATHRRRTITGLLQTDAAINEGNSGGPLLDGLGRVIGINSATASGAQGIGFAIPIDAAASIMASATTH